jgi:aspartate/methionine/tyrosine aminotransferase
VPYYSGFDTDVSLPNGVQAVPVEIPIDELLERKLAELNPLGSDGKAVKGTVAGIILCNPHNPLGRCYPLSVIEGYARLCEKYNIHLLSDELYALSAFPNPDGLPSSPPVISPLSLDSVSLGVNHSRIHILYGVSKDFGSNRIASVYWYSQPIQRSYGLSRQRRRSRWYLHLPS